MVGVRKSRSHLIAVCVIQNILNLNVALLFIRIIGQRASDLIRELIRRIPGLIRNRIGFLCLFFLLDLLGLFGRLCCITVDESDELPPIEPTTPATTSTTMTPRMILPIGFFPSFAIMHLSYDPATAPAHSTS